MQISRKRAFQEPASARARKEGAGQVCSRNSREAMMATTEPTGRQHYKMRSKNWRAWLCKALVSLWVQWGPTEELWVEQHDLIDQANNQRAASLLWIHPSVLGCKNAREFLTFSSLHSTLRCQKRTLKGHCRKDNSWFPFLPLLFPSSCCMVHLGRTSRGKLP